MKEQSAPRAIRSASTAVAVGIAAWNLGNFAFFVLAGHKLGPNDYGSVVALLAIVVAAFIPLSAFQPVAGRPFAVAAPGASGLVRRAVVLSAAIGCAILVLAIGLLRVVDAAWSVPARELSLTLASVVPMAPMFLLLGVLQGTSRFWRIAVVLAAWGALRPLALLALAPAMSDVDGTLLANLVGTVAAALAAGWFARRELASGRRARAGEWRAFRRSLTGPLIGMCGLAVLFNVDVVVAKLSLDPTEAGYFAAVVVLAKAGVVLTPQVLGIALLPQVARRTASGGDTSQFGAIMAVATVAIGALGVVVTAALSDQILQIFGSDFTPAAWMLTPAIAAFIPLGVVVALVNYQIARSDDSFPRSLAAVAALGVVVLAAAGQSVQALLVIDAVVGLVGVATHEVLARRDGSSLRRGVDGLLRRVRRRPVQPQA